jgi:anthranilate synthase/aminodeoxychorismate synthase-like glutamine amidotransferase
MSVLFIDNFDSFAHNLARYFRLLGQQTRVVRNNAIRVEEICAAPPAAIVLSPGPKSPTEAGVSLEVVRRCSGRIPLLGVCLGHQTIGAAFGATVGRAAPMHGRQSAVLHERDGLFADLPSPLPVARYHSLVVEAASVPACLSVTASSGDGLVMALAHREHPTFGVQFHPESVLTEQGFRLLRNFLTIAGLTCREEPPRSVEPQESQPTEVSR